MGLCIFYVLFGVIPFLVQLYYQNVICVIVCLALMCIVNLFLFGLEMLQIKHLTWKIYKQETWNFVELA